jgi:hypothetical protein
MGHCGQLQCGKSGETVLQYTGTNGNNMSWASCAEGQHLEQDIFAYICTLEVMQPRNFPSSA